MKLAILISAAALLLSACSGAVDGEDANYGKVCTGEGVAAAGAWIRPARAGQPTSAAYLTLCNNSDADATLIGASFAGANATELHISKMSSASMASMTHAIELTVPAGSTIVLEPGGAHIMLIGLTDALTLGDDAMITLEFKHAPSVDVAFEVRKDTPGG
jgi:periplasmic copper chaperone A